MYRPGEWLWVDSNGTDGKPTFHRRANLSWLSAICIHCGEIAAWSRKSLTMITYRLRFLKKTPYGHIFTNVFQKDACGRGNTSCVQISWNLADRKSVKSSSSRQYTRSSPNFIQIRSLPAELYPHARTSLKRAIKYFQLLRRVIIQCFARSKSRKSYCQRTTVNPR